jgi:ElaB/YqjD/DUF883 family membrane-anchored ribosome-binding protein
MSDTQQQIEQLRTQVEQLMRDRVTPVVSNVTGRAEDAARRAQANVSDQVRERPLVAMAVAIAIGFLLGRAT